MTPKAERLKRRRLVPLTAKGWESDGLFIRSLSPKQTVELEDWRLANKADNVGALVKLLLLAIVQPDGSPYFDESDFAAIADMDFDEIKAAFEQSAAHNGMTKEGVAEQAKNSPAGEPSAS